MKNTIYKLAALLALSIFSCHPLNMEVPTETCSSSYKINKSHPKAEKLQAKLEEIVALDIPGAVIAIKDSSGIWAAAAGYAKTEKSVPMELCHLQFGQSVAKTYMATAILLLYQEGKIDLDATIDTYLPDTLIQHIGNTQQATVRMLLNHTSGIAEYTSQPDFIDFYLRNPLHQFEPMEFLPYISNKPVYFKPSEGYK
ncbi:serine hydrolase domain-containing protein [Desulfotignum phosphitoxidans]|uniref:Beta-lactamase domain-containing protein n=1 Tax=Desulfotignum phosphitoxidans DSM 13687 TaxID=1286635 RepID=S0G249_9BACT|nr:serine hydrolase domain-containing protein [Desulfotignum phosphitoxidans]EMS78217.1 beta-lactamase domain-containing protein [Desulfotignum phosphitoxidans DSM 13687]